MMMGPMDAPIPQKPCSQFMWREVRWAATYWFMLASTAPPPAPRGIASATSQANEGATDMPHKASPVIMQLAATTAPVPTRATMREVRPALMTANTIMVMVRMPTAASGCPIWTRIAGQATPITASGRPRLTKDR